MTVFALVCSCFTKALVRSPSEELRREALVVLESLAEIDDDVAAEEGEWEGQTFGGPANGSDDVTVTTLLVSIAGRSSPGDTCILDLKTIVI